jgi:hypothetical protein
LISLNPKWICGDAGWFQMDEVVKVEKGEVIKGYEPTL